MAEKSLKNFQNQVPLSKRGGLYLKLSKYPHAVFVNEKNSDQFFVIQREAQKPAEKILSIPRDSTEVIGWFAGKEVVRLR